MRYAVVTGASQGMGRAITEKLLAEGYAVAVCARNRHRMQAVVEEWQARYKNATIIWTDADMGTAEGVNKLATLVITSFGRVDVMVNNAGLYLTGNMANETEGQLEQMINVNLYAAYRLSRALLPPMIEKKSGHVFNICSVASLKGYAGIGSYSISKYALLGFSDNLREELRPYNIKVTAVCPGATWTSSWEGSSVDANRIMEAADIAAAIWAAIGLSPQGNIDTIIMRPVKGDL